MTETRENQDDVILGITENAPVFTSDWDCFNEIHRLLSSDRTAEAEVCANESLALHPNSPHLLCVAARSAKATGNTDLAVRRLQHALDLRDGFLWSYVEYFNLMADLNRHVGLYKIMISLEEKIDDELLSLDFAGALIMSGLRVFSGLFSQDNDLGEIEQSQIATRIHKFLFGVLIRMTETTEFEASWADPLIVHLVNTVPYISDFVYRMSFRREIGRLHREHKIGAGFLATRNLCSAIRVSKPKVAVLIAGQVRGLGAVRENLSRFLAGTDCDVHVCVWNKSGYRVPTLNQETWHFLSRVTRLDIAEFIHRSNIDFGRLVANVPALRALLIHELTEEELFESFEASTVTIEDESRFLKTYGPRVDELCQAVTNAPSMTTPMNQAKMLYMNYQANAIAEQYAFKNKIHYDIKVRVRPDMLINASRYDLAELIIEIGRHSSSIFVNAFGVVPMVGDQFAMGDVAIMDFYFDLWQLVLDQTEGYRMAASLEDPHRRLCDYLASSDVYVRRLPNFIEGYDDSRFIDADALRRILIDNGELVGHEEAILAERDRINLLHYLSDGAASA